MVLLQVEFKHHEIEVHFDVLQRRKHVSSLQETELKALLAGLDHSQATDTSTTQDPLNILDCINNVRRLPGCGRSAPPAVLRRELTKVMLQPWQICRNRDGSFSRERRPWGVMDVG